MAFAKSLPSTLTQDDELNGANVTYTNVPVVPGNSATVSLSHTKLVCVEYPGVVLNVDKMLDTIGGEKGVSKTYSDSTKRLELRYRPKDPYCHPVYGNRYPSTNLLLRIRRRVRKGNSQDVQISMEILGVIETTYKFQAMADIQYLAAHSESDKSWTSLYNKVILRQPEKKEFFDQDVPLFLPPPIFSRLDSTVDYYYRPDTQHKEGYGPPLASSDNLIGLSRARRPHNAIFVNFDDKEVPSEPLEAAKVNWKKVSIHPSEKRAEEEILKLFERRPIWSRNAVKANMDVHPEKLKLLLPYVAYYMLTGPWRSMWVRFGYDPRKSPEAKIYQVLDFRIRCGMRHGYGVGDMPVKAKRSAYHHSLYTTLNKSGPQPASLKDITEESSPSTSRQPAQPRYMLKESAYRFHDGMLPPYRQMFYQLCDLEVEELQKIIHQNDGQEETCDERDGWCVTRTPDELRDIMSTMIKNTIRESKSAGLYQKKQKGGSDPSGTSKGAEDEEEEDEEETEEFPPSDGSGMVSGDNKAVSGLFHYVDIFKGIPFAARPGRFEKPQPHPGWDGVLKATKYSKRCLQLDLLQTGTMGDEDCLYLNIWVPQGLGAVNTKLPVMVWIYGGGFLLGGSMGANFLDNYLYDGEELANKGNVIVVTANYRVGAMGFLSTGDAGIPGNYGLWDQHAAIAWVHRNIKAFGGDPNNLTVFGESAGGASTSFQLITPMNKGLIRRGISQSGVSLCPWAINRNPRAFTELVAQRVGCPTDDTMAACLKMTDSTALTLAGSLDLGGSAATPIVNNLALSPVIDGDFLPDEPANLFVNAADRDYIIGANDMDGHLFTGLDVASVNQPLQQTPVEELKTLLASFTKAKGPQAAELAYNEYTYTWGEKPTREEIKRAIVDAETDYIFLVPTQAALYQHASVATTGRTFSYLFTQPSRMPIYPSWMGADHADDLQYVFGKPFATPLGYWPKHRDVSGYMINYWTNFARTGDPNQGERVPVNWPAFTMEKHEYVDINHNMGRSSVKQKLRLRFVNYWTNTFANMPTIYE